MPALRRQRACLRWAGRTASANARFLWRCQGCKRQFTVRIGSIFEDSRIPLPRLVPCLLACVLQARRASQPSRFTARRAFRHKSALFLMHRIRFAMAADLAGHRSWAGIVEADETYVGGKPRDRARGAGQLEQDAGCLH